jgi:truncated hemoglobin YjbI
VFLSFGYFFTPLSRVFAFIEMAGVKEQRTCIKFCFKLNTTAAETHQMLKEAFHEQALSQARTSEWFKHFKDGRESVEDDKHSVRRSTCTTPEMIAEVLEVIPEDRLSMMFVIALDCHTGHVNTF